MLKGLGQLLLGDRRTDKPGCSNQQEAPRNLSHSRGALQPWANLGCSRWDPAGQGWEAGSAGRSEEAGLPHAGAEWGRRLGGSLPPPGAELVSSAAASLEAPACWQEAKSLLALRAFPSLLPGEPSLICLLAT